MPRNEDNKKARKEEIINACKKLYENKGFKDITLKDIGEETSFTRTLIYYYFHTKEEIFLALMQREYESWIKDLDKIKKMKDNISKDDFANELALSLSKRETLLKLLSMNHYDMEENSRLENLILFKKSYYASMEKVEECLKRFFPQMSKEDIKGFIYAFFPFMFGIYPYTKVSEKQKFALEKAGADYVYMTSYEIIKRMAIKLL